MPVRVMFVCTGNLCRSPMAEALLRHELSARGCGGVDVASSGTWAMEGNGASREAVSVLAARGVDLTPHQSRPLVGRELEAADLIVAMTIVHVEEILSLAPGVEPKVRLLKELDRLRIPESATAAERLAGMLAAARPRRRRSLDLDDPMGLPASSYERCVSELEIGIRALAYVLCGRPGAPEP